MPHGRCKSKPRIRCSCIPQQPQSSLHGTKGNQTETTVHQNGHVDVITIVRHVVLKTFTASAKPHRVGGTQR